MGNLDDVIIDVITNETQVSFGMQLKHKDDKKKRLLPANLEAEKGNFSLKKYCEAFKGLSDVNKQRQFILYTNAKFDPQRIAEVTNFTMIQDDRYYGNIFFNSDEGNVYKFEVNDKTPQNGNITKSDYEIFFSRFRLFVCQKNFEDLEQDMVKILPNDTIYVVPKYLDLFRKWHQGKFTNKKIDKMTVNVHLIDIFLSPFITTDHYFPVGQNEKLKLFEKVIKEFDVTLVNDSFEHFKENLKDDFNPEEGTEEMFKSYKKLYKIEPNAKVHECIMRLAKEIKIIDRSVTVLENEVEIKILQYLFEKPIVVKFSETSEELIYKIMELHQLGSKIKFILVGEGIQSTRLSRFRIFENVNDLRRNDQLYSEVTRTCRLSLQGRKETTLEALIDSCKEICEHVKAKEVLQMLKGKFLIGQATESHSSFYVNRIVCFKEKIDAFLDGTFFTKHLAVVKFERNVKKIQNEIRKRNINVVDLHEYLKSTQISNKPTIISTNEECSEQLPQDVLKKSDNKSVVYLRISEDNGFLIISIKENQIHRLTAPVNILCADPGMGKTTLLKKLRNECDSRFWTIDVDLKTHNEFFKKKHDANELLNHLFEGNENNFSKHIRNVFRCNKKVYFFFDGLDEVEKSCVDNVLDCVKKLSSEGFYIWISSRKNLKIKLEDRFNKVAMMDMEEIEEAQQKFYIRNRLKEEYNHEQIENLISKIFNNSDIDNNRQISGKVLQLYIITQNFFGNKERHQKMTEDTSTFVFTKMYDWFFRGRIKHNRDKQESKNPHLFPPEVEDTLEIYEHLAVHSVFSEEIFQKLNVNMKRAQRFLNQIKENKDTFGIVTKVNDGGKAVFEHFTYGEYFAARFFSSNIDKARLIREELFSDRHKNFMMILNVILAEDNPLHLAVIYRNMDQIKKHIENEKVHDKADRNPLHLATYVEPRFADRNTSSLEVSMKARKYLTNIAILEKMVKFNYADCDKLFQLSALEYAFKNKSFISVEMILKTYAKEYAKEELRQHTKKYINNTNFVVFCLRYGCKNLLSTIFENSEKSKNYIKENASVIIQNTIESCYFQEKETFRFVIDTLDDTYDFNVECTNVPGETVLHLAAKYGKTYAVQILTQRGASVNALTTYNETPLHSASEFGNLETAELLIEKGASVNSLTTYNETPLNVASKREDLKIVALLIDKGASVNALTADNETPLHSASEFGSLETVELLIEKGASVNALTTDNATPLHLASTRGDFETVELLIEKGASVNALTTDNKTPLHLASVSGDLKIVALLIDKGASVNALTADNETPLYSASEFGNLETVELLIEKGASVNALTTDNATPLHLASILGDLKIVALLIDKGASVNALTTDNATPLLLASTRGDFETVELLIEKGASVNALTTDNRTPLHLASERGDLKIVALLIDKGASVNALTTDNETPLHLASIREDFEPVKLLIEKGASVNAHTIYDETPLHLASTRGNLKTVSLLIEKGASVNALKSDNVTPIHLASKRGDLKTVALLIEKGASVNALTTDNRTPLHLASESGNSEIVELLIKKGASVK
jgi:ankyrin repeat protein